MKRPAAWRLSRVRVVYTGSNLAFGLTFAFVLPYLLGALASLDRTGRWTATGGGVQTVGVAMLHAQLGGRRLVAIDDFGVMG